MRDRGILRDVERYICQVATPRFRAYEVPFKSKPRLASSLNRLMDEICSFCNQRPLLWCGASRTRNYHGARQNAVNSVRHLVVGICSASSQRVRAFNTAHGPNSRVRPRPAHSPTAQSRSVSMESNLTRQSSDHFCPQPAVTMDQFAWVA
jgi:hypothetical protein